MTENDPILDVYEQFKHLDRPISEAGQGEDSLHKTCAALWVAEKAPGAGEERKDLQNVRMVPPERAWPNGGVPRLRQPG